MAMVAVMLAITLTMGCATSLVSVGSAYVVKWPGQELDVVQIHEDLGRGWALCRNIASKVVYRCNFNTATWLAPAAVAPAHPHASVRVRR